jgi:hypothetical protein
MSEEDNTMSEVDRLQLLASDRLVFMRVLEKFANEVSGAVGSLRVDVAEIQRQIQIRNEALVKGGSIPVETEVPDVADADEDSN